MPYTTYKVNSKNWPFPNMQFHPILESIEGERQQYSLVVLLMSVGILNGQYVGIVGGV